MSNGVGEVDGRSFAELEVARHESGRLMFADKLRRVNEKGEVEETPVRVCVPTPGDQVEARIRARAWCASKKIDPEKDKDLFGDMEQICLIARAIREYDAPHGQFTDPEDLARDYDESSLHDILERINSYKLALDPRPASLDDETFWKTVLAIAKTANIVPLAGIAGRAHRSFIVRMAKEASNSPTGRHFVQSSESSTQEPSPS